MATPIAKKFYGPIYRPELSGLVRSRVSPQDLHRLIKAPLTPLPPEMSKLDIEITHALYVSKAVLGLFFGREWLRKHATLGRGDGFFKNSPTNSDTLNMHIGRSIEAAELILNFQGKVGVENIYNQIRYGNIEASIAELNAAKQLSRYQIEFCFHTPVGIKGCDYDIDLIHPNGSSCCGEIKAKMENSTSLSENTILGTVKTARDQLPKERPSIILMSVPQNWMTDTILLSDFNRLISKHIPRNVTSIVAYGTTMAFDEVASKRWNSYHVAEFVNPSHNFDGNADWRLLGGQITARHDPFQWIDIEKLCSALGHRFASKEELSRVLRPRPSYPLGET